MNSANFYTCETCHSICGVWRIHCHVCGAVPAMYSMTGKHETSIKAAWGCERADTFRATKAKLVTVTLDYYAGA